MMPMMPGGQMPGMQAPPVDTGNKLLGEVPSELSLAHLDTTGGKRLAMTIRTPCATFTLLLSKEDGIAWSEAIGKAASELGGLLIPQVVPPMLGGGNGE